MKKLMLFLFSLITVSAMQAAEFSPQLIEAAIETANVIKFNRKQFVTQSGFVERGVLGYCTSYCCPTFSRNLMRKRLKEKDLLCNGEPLANHQKADALLDAFLKLKGIKLCPLQYEGEVCVNNVQAFKAQLAVALTPVSCSLCAAAAVLGCCAGYTTGSLEAGLSCCGASCLGMQFPYFSAAHNTFVLREVVREKGIHVLLARMEESEDKKDR